MLLSLLQGGLEKRKYRRQKAEKARKARADQRGGCNRRAARRRTRLLTIDRPDYRNAIDGTTADEMQAAYEAFAADEDARVLVLTGAGEKGRSARARI